MLPTNLDDLDSLQSTLEEVQSHLSQLQHGTEYDDLVALRDQLRELISIKQQDAPIHGLPQSDQPSQFDTNLRDSLIGQRCSLPGWLANGKYVQQSVVICDVVEPGDHDSIGRVRVLFAHPTRISDVPCAELLNHGSCPRGLRCPNSHGSIVSVEELIDWNAPDEEIVTKEGQPCLVKDSKSTGLWHYAHILHTDAESGMCVVELGSKNSSGSKRRTYHRLEDSVLNVPLESVHILTQDEAELYENETSDVFEDDDSSGDEVYVSYSKTSITPGSSHAEDILPHKPRKRIQFVPGGILMPEDILRPVQVKDPVNLVSVESAEPLGAWEAHTRGIGSRLLAKVGYDATHGLGHSGQGRRLPVALILDKFQIRPSKWNKRPCLDRVVTSHMDESSEGKKRTSTRDKINSGDLGVFRTINAALGRAREEPMPELVVESAKVQQFKLHEEIQNVSREIQRAEQSYKRNVGRDRVIAKQVQDRLSTLQNRLSQLQNRERTLKQKAEQTQHSGKKLRIF